LIQIQSANAHRPGLVALEPSDGAPVARLFGRLSNESIHRRFFSPISRPEQFVAAILRVDRRDRVAIAAVENGEIVGVAQYARKQGLGRRLVASLADRAASHGITAFAVDVQGDNYGVIKLLRRVAPGIHLAFSGGVGEGSFPLTAKEGS